MKHSNKPSKIRQITDSLKQFGLNPSQWALAPNTSTERPWVILQNREDKGFQLKGLKSGFVLKEIQLHSIK